MTARNKARRAEDTSDLNTGDEAGEQKRRRIPKIITSEESSDSEIDLLAPPPKIKKTLNLNGKYIVKGFRGHQLIVVLFLGY